MSIVLKTLAELEQRELFLIEGRFAIYVRPFEGGQHGFVALDTLKFDTWNSPGEHVVSYGKDWFLDVEDVAFTDNAEGGVYIGANGLLIAAQGDKALEWLDAATAETATRPAALARAGRWWIWASREDWASPNGSPLVIPEDDEE